jgi:hypothetical protein
MLAVEAAASARADLQIGGTGGTLHGGTPGSASDHRRWFLDLGMSNRFGGDAPQPYRNWLALRSEFHPRRPPRVAGALRLRPRNTVTAQDPILF